MYAHLAPIVKGNSEICSVTMGSGINAAYFMVAWLN
jgi:hypothetical protein